MSKSQTAAQPQRYWTWKTQMTCDSLMAPNATRWRQTTYILLMLHHEDQGTASSLDIKFSFNMLRSFLNLTYLVINSVNYSTKTASILNTSQTRLSCCNTFIFQYSLAPLFHIHFPLPLYPEAMFTSKAVRLWLLMQCLELCCNPNREAWDSFKRKCCLMSYT